MTYSAQNPSWLSGTVEDAAAMLTKQAMFKLANPQFEQLKQYVYGGLQKVKDNPYVAGLSKSVSDNLTSDNLKKVWAHPGTKATLIGAGVGAGAGALTSLRRPRDERQFLRSALKGGLAGGAIGGGGYLGLQGIKSLGQPPDNTEIDRLNKGIEETGTAQRKAESTEVYAKGKSDARTGDGIINIDLPESYADYPPYVQGQAVGIGQNIGEAALPGALGVGGLGAVEAGSRGLGRAATAAGMVETRGPVLRQNIDRLLSGTKDIKPTKLPAASANTLTALSGMSDDAVARVLQDLNITPGAKEVLFQHEGRTYALSRDLAQRLGEKSKWRPGGANTVDYLQRKAFPSNKPTPKPRRFPAAVRAAGRVKGPGGKIGLLLKVLGYAAAPYAASYGLDRAVGMMPSHGGG